MLRLVLSPTTADVLSVLRDVVAGMVTEIRRSAVDEATLAGADLPDVPDEIPIVHFRDALGLVGANPDEPDLAPEQERQMGRWAKQKFGSEFLAVEGYPTNKRPFYTHPSLTTHTGRTRSI
jgi:nondiscriminating aspartyl-tRNA synthetase